MTHYPDILLFVCCFPGLTTHWVVSFTAQLRALASSFSRFLDHTQRRATVGRTPLDEWSIRRRDLYLTTHNTHNRQTYIPPVGFETTIAAGERPKTYALDRAATWTGILSFYVIQLGFEVTPFNKLRLKKTYLWVGLKRLRNKHDIFYLKNQFEPCRKHSPSLL